MSSTSSLAIALIDHPEWIPTTGNEGEIADILRQVVAALGASTRRRIISTAAGALGAGTADALTAIRRGLDALDAAGDVLVGPGGHVAVAPLFVVRQASDGALLIGGVPSREVREIYPTMALEEGTPRRFVANAAALGVLVERFGGREVSLDAWSGLDAAAPADTEWLTGLTKRLEATALMGGTERLDAVAPSDRQQYVPATEQRPQGFGWASANPPAGPTLLRWRDGRADWCFGWATATSWPGALRLSSDDAARTRFALDRLAGGSLPVEVAPSDTFVTLRVNGRLPRAEYRYLVAHARTMAREGWSTVFVLPADSWEGAAGVLRDRLGLPV